MDHEQVGKKLKKIPNKVAKFILADKQGGRSRVADNLLFVHRKKGLAIDPGNTNIWKTSYFKD